MRIFKSAMVVVLMSLVVASLTACGGDDDDDLGSTSSSNALIINGTTYGNLPYAIFTVDEDGTASFIFSSVRMVNSIDPNAPLTFLSVRIPYSSGGIPTGVFSADVDADFDVNRVPSTGKCDLTGWSVNQTMKVSKSGDKYIVDFVTNDLHIYHSDNEIDDGQSGSLVFHYEGKIEIAES